MLLDKTYPQNLQLILNKQLYNRRSNLSNLQNFLKKKAELAT